MIGSWAFQCKFFDFALFFSIFSATDDPFSSRNAAGGSV